MTDVTVSVKFDACKYRVIWPDFFLECSITTAKRILRWLCQYRNLNEESWSAVDKEMPELEELAHKHLDKALDENRTREEMDIAKNHYYRWEDQQDVHRYYQNRARHLRKMPERAKQLQAFWKELNDG